MLDKIVKLNKVFLVWTTGKFAPKSF